MSNDRAHCQPIASRRGFTLIEMVITFSMLGALMSFGIVLLALLLRADTAGHNALEQQLTLGRLERQFRADVHESVDATVADDGQTLEIRWPDERRADWSISDRGVSRQVLDGQSITSREDYELPEGETRFHREASSAIVELQRKQTPIGLTETQADQMAPPSRQVKIQAVAGLAVLTAAPQAGQSEEP